VKALNSANRTLTSRGGPWRPAGAWRARLILLLVALCGLPGAVQWCLRRSAVLTADQQELVSSMVEQTSNIHVPGQRIHVAIFCAQTAGGDPTAGVGPVFQSDRMWWCELVGPLEIANGALVGFDLVIFPGGSGSQQSVSLGEEGRRAVREFVRDGGGYIGICGGAFLGTAGYEWSLGLINARTLTGRRAVPGGGEVDMASRGCGTVSIDLTHAGRQIFANLPRRIDVDFSGGPIFSPAERADLPGYIPLAVFRTEVCEHEIQKGTMVGTPAIIAGQFGEGRVIMFSPHPEASEGVESLLLRAALAAARRLDIPDAMRRGRAGPARAALGFPAGAFARPEEEL